MKHTLSISPSIKEKIPTFKLGLITYHHIVISDSPQMFKGRFRLFQEEVALNLETEPITSYEGIKEWRSLFKLLGIDPGRYRPSCEALIRRVKKREFLQPLHSAVDFNNFFSLQYEIPFGIYDSDKLLDTIELRLGNENDTYEGINGRENKMNGKLVTADESGAFGSPIVDSKRTMVTESTTNAIHIVYLRASMTEEECKKMLQSIAEMFTNVHGGTAEVEIIH